VRLAGIMVAIAAGAVLAGCATRDDYSLSSASDGLFKALDDLLVSPPRK